MTRRLIVAGGTLLASLALAPAAGATQTNFSTTLGPISIPNAPVQVCMGLSCQTTPSLRGIFVNVMGVYDDASTPPTMTKGACATGRAGGTVTVTAGSGPALVGGSYNGTRLNGAPYMAWLPAVTLPANGTVTISACT